MHKWMWKITVRCDDMRDRQADCNHQFPVSVVFETLGGGSKSV